MYAYQKARSQINERHKEFWLERLETDDGNVIRFCQLNWRGDILPISLQTPGYDAFATMNFSDAIGRIGVLFNVPNASVPSGGSMAGFTGRCGHDMTKPFSLCGFIVMTIRAKTNHLGMINH